MDAKCDCERIGVIKACSRDQPRCDCKIDGRHDNNSNSALYWAHVNPSNSSRSKKVNVSSIVSINSEAAYSSQPNNPTSFKDMASWRHPSTTCLAPCISIRRLNRTYSEHRMRCFLTTIVAFCLGISVGALLPFIFPAVEIFPLPHIAADSGGVTTESSINAGVNFLPTPQQQWAAFPVVEATSARALEIPNELELETVPIMHSSVSFVDNSINSLQEEKTLGESSNGVPVVEGIFWSDWVERLLPRGFSDEDAETWRSVVGNSTVASVESGCGRMQNRLVTYQSGKKACCRYRQNFDQIQGEIFSFYLSQLLGIKNLAPSTMDVINSKSDKWNGVLGELVAAQWADERPVVLTQFVNNLDQAFIPKLLRSSTRRVHPIDLPPISVEGDTGGGGQGNSSSDHHVFEDLRELAQWSDLIVFDYLTANLDRMVNNLYNLQWNPSMMEAPAHNLAKETSTGLLVFLDNESGLLHGYRLLDKYEHYHRLMLDSLCVFRKSTAEAIRRLHEYGSIQPLFKSMLSQFTKSQLVPMIPDKSIKVLNQRIETVHRQIQKCQSLYSSNRTGNSKSSV